MSKNAEKLANKSQVEENNNLSKNDRKAVRPTGNRLVALCGVFIALAMILSYVESLIPVSAAVPGIKLGLANLVTIVSLKKLGIKPTIVISAGRIILSGFLFSNLTVIMYSLAGAALSIIVMVFVSYIRVFTVTGVSICGAIAHNLGQLIVAAIVLENVRIMYYIAVLGLSGAVFGALIGVLAGYIICNIRI
jgi:heptaprenyl diphosphate synthase